MSPNKKDEEVVTQKVPITKKQQNAFSLEELKRAWADFLEHDIIRKNDLVLVTLKRKITLVNESEVHLALANHIEIDGLEKIKIELTGFLRKELQNDFIDVIADVNEEKVEKKAYTNADKFEKMMNKHPILKELKDRLGLDPDF